MCRPSNIDGRCEIRLLYLLKLLILELYANYAEGLHFSAFIIIVIIIDKRVDYASPETNFPCGVLNGVLQMLRTDFVYDNDVVEISLLHCLMVKLRFRL